MGTRNMILVKSEKKIKLGQYSQWDGYPTGQGVDICDFITKNLRHDFDFEKFNKALNNCINVESDEELSKMYESIGVLGDSLTFEQADKFKSKWPGLSRDTGADILNLVFKGYTRHLNNVFSEKEPETWWCEFGYVIDLDTQTLSVYEGYPHPSDSNLACILPFSECKSEYMEHLELYINNAQNIEPLKLVV